MLEHSLRKFRTAIYLSEQVLKDCQNCNDHKSKLAAQMAVVSLQDEWASFVREIIFSSATGRASTTSGQKISCPSPVHNETDFLQRLGLSPTDREPNWHVAQTAITKLRAFNPSNFRSVAANLGSTTSPEKFMRDYRNFVVHKYRNTAQRLTANSEFVRLGYSGNLTELIFGVKAGGLRIYEDWIRRFDIIASLCVRDP